MDLVVNLHRAALENRKEELKARVLGFSVAVMNGIDMALGGGKGRILDRWLKAMEGSGDSGDGFKRKPLSRSAREFFGNAPVVVKKG
jgi:hypothetical protein